MCTRFRSPPKNSPPSSVGSKRPSQGAPGSRLPSPGRVKRARHSAEDEPEGGSTTEEADASPSPTTDEGGAPPRTSSPATSAPPAGHGTVAPAQPKHTFIHGGEPFIGVDFDTVKNWIAPQETAHSCWAATLAYVAMMLIDDFVDEAMVKAMVKEIVGEHHLRHYLENGVPPRQYLEVISILKERLGVTAKELRFSQDGAFESLLQGRPVIVSVGENNDHVLLLLGYQEGDPGKVFVYDTAIEDGGIKTPGIQTFVDAANQMFLMDLYTSRSQSS